MIDNCEIFKYFVIRLKSKNSIELSERCYNSCVKHDVPIEYWEAIDGTDGKNIIIPNYLQNEKHLKWIKYHYNDLLSTSAISCFLTHFSLWCYCITVDKPIVVMEEDTILVKKLKYHPYKNSIIYLGNKEQKEKGLQEPFVYFGLPPNHKYFMRRAHAYAIEPCIARKLVSDLICNGIDKPVDMFLEYEKYSIIQDGLYAYDDRPDKNNTSITYNIDYKSKGIIVGEYK